MNRSIHCDWVASSAATAFLAAGTALAALPSAAQPIQLHPENPHYFLWRSKPAILITAGEHYGAMMNLDFNYVRYLDELKADRFNLSRIFSGTYREVAGSFDITGNTLAPSAGRFVCPWARSGTPGASDGGNKFDLTKWNDQIIATLVETEAPLPKKHLIAQGFPPSSAPVSGLHPRVSVLNFHAAKPDAVLLNHPSNRVIAFDETGGSDRSDRKYQAGWINTKTGTIEKTEAFNHRGRIRTVIQTSDRAASRP